MIVVTGAVGFIGSNLIEKLNEENFNDIIAVDKFDRADKNRNLEGLTVKERIDREEFISWLNENGHMVEFIFHIGAKTDTTLFDVELLTRMNTEYTKDVWSLCIKHQIPLVYASSAATYGLGEYGYDDNDISCKPLILCLSCE